MRMRYWERERERERERESKGIKRKKKADRVTFQMNCNINFSRGGKTFTLKIKKKKIFHSRPFKKEFTRTR